MDATSLPQTKAERAAYIEKLFVGVTPAEQKPQSLLSVLKPYRPMLIAKHRQGFSLRQIAERIKASSLALEVSPSTLRDLMSGPAAKRRAKMKKLAAQRAANLAAAKTTAATPPPPPPATPPPATAPKK
jgi:hypothetical protein